MFLPVSRVLLIALSLVATSLSGCATSSGGYSVGRDFNSSAVSQIVKGETTKDDIVRMFGEPFSKTVISENEEKWMYVYDAGTVKVQGGVFAITTAQVTGKILTVANVVSVNTIDVLEDTSNLPALNFGSGIGTTFDVWVFPPTVESGVATRESPLLVWRTTL